MSLKCGIVGLPNVGKSTLFNALTRAGVAAENFPFCTIDAHAGIVPVPDPRLDRLAAIVQPQKVVAATVEFTDIAGLVAGASRGEGLGNRFLATIRECHAIAHVVRCFEDTRITHVTGRIDPLADVETVETELALADLETVDRNLLRLVRLARSGDQEARHQVLLLERVKAHLDQARPVRTLEPGKEQLAALQPLHLLTLKPVMYIANVDEGGLVDNPHLERVRAYAETEGAPLVALCNKLEAEIAELEAGEKLEFLRELGMGEAGLDRLIRAAYQLLGLQTFFTAGDKEARAWTVSRGATAPLGAGVIHSDFAKGFIRAEVISWQDFIANGGEQGAKEQGKWRLEGKDYVLQDGDVIHFRYNV